jgi:hypothetical protein
MNCGQDMLLASLSGFDRLCENPIDAAHSAAV